MILSCHDSVFIGSITSVEVHFARYPVTSVDDTRLTEVTKFYRAATVLQPCED